MLEKIISGGQTGADQAAWRVAKAYGVTTGGWMPNGGFAVTDFGGFAVTDLGGFAVTDLVFGF
jgi:Circularly permutated YpsA SLOG family